MKKQLFAVSLLVLGFQGIAHATYPADAEWSQNLPARGTFADRHAGSESATWGVSKRAVEPHNPFPFGGGYIDD